MDTGVSQQALSGCTVVAHGDHDLGLPTFGDCAARNPGHMDVPHQHICQEPPRDRTEPESAVPGSHKYVSARA